MKKLFALLIVMFIFVGCSAAGLDNQYTKGAAATKETKGKSHRKKIITIKIPEKIEDTKETANERRK